MSVHLYHTVLQQEAGQVQPLHLTPGQYQSAGALDVLMPFRERCTTGEDLYGFLAEDFFAKTGLSAADMHQFMQQHPGKDVYTFSPFVAREALSPNVFVSGEDDIHLNDVAQAFLAQVGLDLQVSTWVTAADYMAPVQYIVAGPLFWTTWFDLAGTLMEMAADPANPLASRLAEPVGNTSVKWLLADRLASVVMALDQELKLARLDPFRMPALSGMPAQQRRDWQSLDGLKKAWQLTQVAHYLEQYAQMRSKFMPAQSSLHAGWDDPDLIYVCTSHVPLPVAMPDKVIPFYLGNAQQEGPNNTITYAPEWEGYNRSVAGMIGLFAIRNYILRHRPSVKRIGICSYRKFVSRERITGVPAEDNWMMDVVTENDRRRQSLEEMMSPGDTRFMVGKPCGLVVDGHPASYLEHYAFAHHAEDLLRVAAVAVEIGVFTRQDVSAFLNEKEFYIAGIELGIFPADFWLDAVGQIEAILRVCVAQYPQHREGYQRRSWAFCAERLSSYMIARYLRAHYRDPASCYGQLNLIARENETRYTYGGLTEES